MRTRRWVMWAAFTVSVLAVLEGLGWTTYQLLGSERREAERRTVLRALWTMDSALNAIIAPETARPFFHYQPLYPEGRAYNQMLGPIGPDERLVPSPLLTDRGPFIRLYFQLSPETGELVSPQVPPEGALTEQAKAAVPPEQIAAAARDLDRVRTMFSPESLAAAAGLDAETPPEPGAPGSDQLAIGPVPAQAQRAADPSQSEYEARRQVTSETLGLNAPPFADTATGDETDPRRVEHGALRPYWWAPPVAGEPELFLLRTVRAGEGSTVQGIWVDWPALRRHLLGLVQASLPTATFSPILGENAEEPFLGPRLAAIPAALVPGSVHVPPGPLLTPTRMTLLMTWIAVVLAIGAVGLVLRASMVLSERRGRFVYAVTHELRTPLTTFCLYAQMLADGMVRDDKAKAEYTGTLKRESRRLAQIVENVLEYARLGDRPRPPRLGRIPVTELIARVVPALQRRAEQSGMTLIVSGRSPDQAREFDWQLAGSQVEADPQSVERILMNLVDNSCKYASEAEDRRLHLDARTTRSSLEIVYWDHGPGIRPRDRAKVFSPFHRSERDADGPNPGLGLGLALSRGLARELGGDLVLVDPYKMQSTGGGAKFLLLLPLARA